MSKVTRGTFPPFAALVLLLGACGTLPPLPETSEDSASSPGGPDLRYPLPEGSEASDPEALPPEVIDPVAQEAQRRAAASRAASYALLEESREAALTGNRAAAIGYIERALRLSPREPSLWVELGRLQMPDAPLVAQRYARKALALCTPEDPSYREAWLLIADAKERDGDPGAAEAIRDRFRSMQG